MKTKILGGITKIKFDPRHFSWKKKFGSLTNVTTSDFDVYVPLITKDQGANNLCADYGATGAAEAQFGTVLDEAFQRAAHNKLTNTPGYTGATSPMDAALTIVKYGALPKADAIYDVTNAKFADISNYPQSLVLEANNDKEFSVYTVNGQADRYDSIVAAMWQSKINSFPTPIMTGCKWDVSWLNAPNGIIPAFNPANPSTLHEFIAVGQKTINGELRLKCHLSSGSDVGDTITPPGGYFYFNRAQVNAFTFALAFGQGSPADYQAEYWNVFQKLYHVFYTWYASLNAQPVQPITVIDSTPPASNGTQPPQPIAPVSRIPLWAQGIKTAEGWFTGSRSQKNHNGGNLKFTTLTASFGAVGKDADNFCIFPNDAVGDAALESFLILACKDELLAFHANPKAATVFENPRTLAGFTLVYAQPPKAADGSYPYLNIVAATIGAKVDQLISELL